MLAPIDVTDIRIETQRLILRPWQETDLNDFMNMPAFPAWVKWQDGITMSLKKNPL